MKKEKNIETFDVQKVFQEIIKEEGVLLNLTTVPEDTASFLWGRINIPPKFIKKGQPFFEAIVRHEVGHRVVPYAPSTIERGITCQEIAIRERIEDVPSFLNIVYDFMVDGKNYNEDPKKYEILIIESLSICNKSFDPRLHFYGEILKQILGKKTKLTKAKKIYNLLFLDGRVFYTRLREIAQLMKSFFTNENKDEYGSFCINPKKDKSNNSQQNNPNGNNITIKKDFTLADIVNPIETFDIDCDSNIIDLTKLARELQEANIIIEIDSDKLTMKNRQTQLYMIQQYLKLIDKYVEVIENKGNRLTESTHPKIWCVGDDPSKLDIIDTIQRHGIIIPGVTTLKKGKGNIIGNGGAGSIMLILDNSYSTKDIPSSVYDIPNPKKVIDTIREAAFCITETARRNGDEIGAVGFSTQLVWNTPLSNTNYKKIIDNIILMGPKNGTEIKPPVLWALNQINKKYYNITTFLITDGQIDDLSESINNLKEINERGKLIVFLISNRNKDGKLDELPQIFVDSGFTVYIIEAGQDFSEEALEEINV